MRPTYSVSVLKLQVSTDAPSRSGSRLRRKTGSTLSQLGRSERTRCRDRRFYYRIQLHRGMSNTCIVHNPQIFSAVGAGSPVLQGSRDVFVFYFVSCTVTVVERYLPCLHTSHRIRGQLPGCRTVLCHFMRTQWQRDRRLSAISFAGSYLY